MDQLVRKTLEQIMAEGGGYVDRARVLATTEEDIRQHMIEDGEDPDAPLPDFRAVPEVRAVRERLHLTEDALAHMMEVHPDDVRDWEAHRNALPATARALLRVIDREPEAALRALSS